jgi:hypothetical protein
LLGAAFLAFPDFCASVDAALLALPDFGALLDAALLVLPRFGGLVDAALAALVERPALAAGTPPALLASAPSMRRPLFTS